MFIRNISRILLVVFLSLLSFIYLPTIIQEVRYSFQDKKYSDVVVSYNEITKGNSDNTVIVAKDSKFGLIIPKLGINTPIIDNIDAFDKNEYQLALTKGIAHAKGSSYPGQIGNVFLFSHSSNNLIDAIRYNSQFYLLDKLEKGNSIYVAYNNIVYKYTVLDKKIVSATDIELITQDANKDEITLMTCWPAGTTFKRLVVVGSLTK